MLKIPKQLASSTGTPELRLYNFVLSRLQSNGFKKSCEITWASVAVQFSDFIIWWGRKALYIFSDLFTCANNFSSAVILACEANNMLYQIYESMFLRSLPIPPTDFASLFNVGSTRWSRAVLSAY